MAIINKIKNKHFALQVEEAWAASRRGLQVLQLPLEVA